MSHWNDFSGRSRRSEYWWTTLFAVVLLTAVGFIDAWFVAYDYPEDFPLEDGNIISAPARWWIEFRAFPTFTIAYYLMFIPLMAVGVRRFHDVGRSGYWVVIWFIAAEFYEFFAKPEPFLFFDIINGDSLNISANWLTILLGCLIYVLLSLIILYFSLLDSQKEPNRFGASPKYSA